MRKKLAILVVTTCIVTGALAVCIHFRSELFAEKPSNTTKKTPDKDKSGNNRNSANGNSANGSTAISDKNFLLKNSDSKNFILNLSNQEIKISSPAAGRYIANYYGKFIEVDASDPENIKIIDNNGLVAQGSMHKNTIKLTKDDKSYLWVKFSKPGYIRLRDKMLWEIKRTKNRWKLYRGGFEIGKVKLYSTGKLAIKDSFSDQVGFAKNVGKLSVGATAFLNEFISQEKQVAIFLLFLALDK